MTKTTNLTAAAVVPTLAGASATVEPGAAATAPAADLEAAATAAAEAQAGADAAAGAEADAAAAKAAAEAQAQAEADAAAPAKPKGSKAKSAAPASAADLRAGIDRIEAGNHAHGRAAMVEGLVQDGAQFADKDGALHILWLGVRVQTTAGLANALNAWCGKARRTLMAGEAL